MVSIVDSFQNALWETQGAHWTIDFSSGNDGQDANEATNEAGGKPNKIRERHV